MRPRRMSTRMMALLTSALVVGTMITLTGPANANLEGSQVRGFQASLLSAGGSDTCVIHGAGKVRCWGFGYSGELGNDAMTDVGSAPGSMAVATDVPLSAPAKSVSAGGDQNCAVLTTGAVRCWGRGDVGQLGNDGTGSIGDVPGSMQLAHDVALPAAATAVAAGYEHTCAVLISGKVRCWGLGTYGELGNDATTNIGDAPGTMEGASDVPLPATAIAIAAGQAHTCALLSTGKVRCWGQGMYGQLGNDATANIGDVAGSMEAASDVPLPAAATAIVAAARHTCALLTGGIVRCWGQGMFGQLGNDSASPVGTAPGSMAAATNVHLAAAATAITADNFHSCAILVTGKARCWGAGGMGRLGTNTTGDIGAAASSMENATDVLVPSDVTAVDAGSLHTCGLLATGAVRCWGEGDGGRLGSDATNDIGSVNTPTNGMQAAVDVAGVTLPGRVADVSLTATATPATTVVGAQTTVTVIVANAGPDAVDALAASAPAPVGTTLLAATQSQGTYAATSSTWAVGTLASGASATLTLTVQTAAVGTHSAAVEVTSTSITDPDSAPGNGATTEDDYALVSVVTTAPAPVVLHCKVPKVAGLTVAAAKPKLKKAHCALGKVVKPKGATPKGFHLVIKSASPKGGTTHPAGAKIKLTLKRARILVKH